MPPTSSCTMRDRVCPAPTFTSSRLFLAKPSLSSESLYDQGARAENTSTPPVPVAVVCVTLVSLLVSVTVASDTVAPAGSVTTPWMPPRNCASAVAAQNDNIARAHASDRRVISEENIAVHPQRRPAADEARWKIGRA